MTRPQVARLRGTQVASRRWHAGGTPHTQVAGGTQVAGARPHVTTQVRKDDFKELGGAHRQGGGRPMKKARSQ